MQEMQLRMEQHVLEEEEEEQEIEEEERVGVEGEGEVEGEELNEEASHSTITFASRGVTQSIQSSMQAVQDPNPRQQEDDSVRGGSIPPVIEIESQDQEGNEEMSVLTLPQEESASLAFNLEGTTFHSQNAEEGSTMSPIDEASDNVSGIYDESQYDDLSQLNSIGSLSIRHDMLPESEESEQAAEEIVEQIESVVIAVEQPIEPAAEQPESESVPVSEAPSSGLQCPPGYDIAVFESLPPDMQLEVIQQHGETSDNMRELIDASGFDYETIMSLPEEIRQEVLDQARRQLRINNPESASSSSAAATGAPQSVENENVAFLASLSLELRAEVLLTADAEFLATLPPEIAAEAQNLREQAASNWQRREIIDRVTGPMVGRLSADQPSPGDQHSPDEDDDYESDNSEHQDYDSDDPYSSNIPRLPAAARRRPPTAAEPKKKLRNGLMTIPREKSIPSNLFPPQTLVAMTRSLLSSKKHPKEFADLLLKAILNVCHTEDMKLQLSKLLTGCFVQDKEMVDKVLKQITSGELTLSGLMQGISLESTSSERARKFTLQKSSPKQAALTSVALYRLLHVISNLCNSHAGFIHAFLCSEPGTHSLLEELFQAFPVFIMTGKVREMESTMSLIEQITAPLDQLPELFASAADITEEMKAADEKQQTVTVVIPQVQLAQESLSQLCDVLLSDVCNHKIFTSITNTISRLAKIRTNNFYLLELLNDVIVDLAEQSKWKLNEFGEYLSSLHIENSSTTTSVTDKQSPPLIPLGEYGSKQYERLLRLLQTFQSMFEKSQSSSFVDHIQVENLVEVWQMLDNVLTKLRVYLVTDDEDSHHSTDEASAMQKSSNPQQTVLVSILRRMQPAMEAFLLVHTLDLLQEKDNNSNNNSSDGEQKADGNTTSDTSVSSSKPPGHRYRLHREYQSANISLMADAVTSSSSLSSNELRRQVSFTHVSSMSKVSSLLSSKNQKLIGFVQQHRGLLNALIKSKPSLLHDGAFASLLRIVQLRPLISFENKRKYFYHRLKKFQQTQTSRRSIGLQVRRTQVFEDSFHQLRSRKAEDLRGRLQISFYGEEGIDAGGLSREWFLILSREIFNPNYALFMAAADGATFQPNPLSVINSNHLDYFKFVGRVIGKALCDGQLMDAHFTRSFYKHVLGLPIEFSDIESTEPDYYKSLKLMLENPLDMLGMSGSMTFTAEIQKFGRIEDIDLIPNGSQIVVTDDNKHEYVRLVAQHRMTTAINAQIDSFLSGFYELIPPELICIFTPAEVELLICGLPDVNVDELQANTEYQQYRATDDSIVWFWDALRSFNREQRAAFLQFVTGTSKVSSSSQSPLESRFLYFFFAVISSVVVRCRWKALPTCKACEAHSAFLSTKHTEERLACCRLHTRATTR
jgi:E3 ubiquitin-protein ligase HUWE1